MNEQFERLRAMAAKDQGFDRERPASDVHYSHDGQSYAEICNKTFDSLINDWAALLPELVMHADEREAEGKHRIAPPFHFEIGSEYA